jgi:hypothetical protein
MEKELRAVFYTKDTGLPLTNQQQEHVFVPIASL